MEIVFIVPRFDNQDPILKSWADDLNIPFLCAENVNSPEFLNILRKFSADIFVSMSFDQILKKDIIDLTPEGLSIAMQALFLFIGDEIL